MKYIVMSDDRGTIYSSTRTGTHRTQRAAQHAADQYNHAMQGMRTAHVEDRPGNYIPHKCDIYHMMG